MRRSPVSSTSVGGPSNAICHGPKPRFDTPMKGVTRMHDPHDTPPWTPQRTRALFRLFQTSAPPDFQRQVLARLAQRQHAQQQRRRGWRPLLAWRLGGRAWRRATPQRHRRWSGHALAILGCWGLVLGASLVWWVAPLDPPAPALRLSQAVSLPQPPDVPTAAPRRGDDHRGFESAATPERAGQAAGPPTSSTSVPQMPRGQSVDKRTAFQAGDDPARTLLVPAPGSQLTAQKARQFPVHRYSQRSGRPRGAPGKPSRTHPRGGTSQQAPG